MESIHLDEKSRRSATCPYCHDSLASNDLVWACPQCETRHHQSCAQENRLCTVFGCGAPVEGAEPIVAPEPPDEEAAAHARLERLEQRLSQLAYILVALCALGVPAVPFLLEHFRLAAWESFAGAVGGGSLFVLFTGFLGGTRLMRYLRLSTHDAGVKGFAVFICGLTMLSVIVDTVLATKLALGSSRESDFLFFAFFLGLTMIFGLLGVSLIADPSRRR